jgi:hypothetical protein
VIALTITGEHTQVLRHPQLASSHPADVRCWSEWRRATIEGLPFRTFTMGRSAVEKRITEPPPQPPRARCSRPRAARA